MGWQGPLQPFSLMSWKCLILLGDVLACLTKRKSHLWHLLVKQRSHRGVKYPVGSGKWGVILCLWQLLRELAWVITEWIFFMGSFLATQIDPGATVYNLRVQLWQGLWGFRPLYMWILVRKNWVFSKNMPWKLPGCGRAGLKTSFYKDLVNFLRKSIYTSNAPSSILGPLSTI